MANIENYTDQAVTLVMEYGPKLLLAILFLVVGFIIIKSINNLLMKIMERRELDSSLRHFLKTLSSILLKTLLIISVMSMIGVEMTSFIAVIGAAGLAVGLALQGTLQNFAGGVLILILKPFNVGDYIETQGHAGTVKEIQIFNTILKTPDNKTIIVPNSPVATNSLINYSTEPRRRVDFSFGIGYNDDIDKAKSVLKSIIEADSRILNDPEPFIAVGELADSSVNFTVRVWVESVDYWPVHFDMIEKVKKEFDNQNISIPFPQQDVHLFQNN